MKEAFPTTFAIPTPKRTKYQNSRNDSPKQLLRVISGEDPTRNGGYGFHLNAHINYNLSVQTYSNLVKTD